jgi:hypothetical protein
MRIVIVGLALALAGVPPLQAGESTIAELKDLCSAELRYTGLEVKQPVTIHILARGGGGDYGWSYKSRQLFAYGWIIDASTRSPVWVMTIDNTSTTGDDREFDGSISLKPGKYEAYFTAYAFAYHTTFSHFISNVDHRMTPLFGTQEKPKGNVVTWFKSWWSDDIEKEWKNRCAEWGLELKVDDGKRSAIATYALLPRPEGCAVQALGLGDNVVLRKAFSVSKPTTVIINALGEGTSGKEMNDYGWIVDMKSRERIWSMEGRTMEPAGGAPKNLRVRRSMTLDAGNYLLYYVTDGSHSMDDWNAEPPYDPLRWGISVCAESPDERGNISEIPYEETQNVIVKLVGVRDNETRSEGFVLKEDSDVRIYAFGERSNARRTMADYGQILDARTREKVWSMDVDRTMHAGGAEKNRYIDEIIRLPRGSYVVTYTTDDSHAYDDWNDDPPFDPENYGITVMGAGPGFSSAMVGKYVETRDKNILAQIVRVRDDANASERFSLDRTTRLRVYAIGEGQNREMFDYGWIENAKTGAIVWEMTYSMTMHAGGGRKNRSVNTTVLLERGDYVLRFRSDDSHSFGDWNVDPPEDATYWGITVYRDEPVEAAAPAPPQPPAPPKKK